MPLACLSKSFLSLVSIRASLLLAGHLPSPRFIPVSAAVPSWAAAVIEKSCVLIKTWEDAQCLMK
ncbi:hypothetical protein E2C01_054631 [Portunus trituberculatus]|uniref:Secreted protein n=1 Tax=Portunus trituberculatus TaxID=210409 RepID=A0A5B7GU90_PORTR|nr:hypothetical protein [Portunus trituberculatus]